MTRILPDIPNITAEWTHECSEIPDYLVVPLADGRVIRYYPRLDKPTFVRRADGKVGYQYKSKIFEGVEI